MTSSTLAELSSPLGIDVEIAGRTARFSRQSGTLALDASPFAALDLSVPLDRHLAFCVLSGIRLAFDWLLADFEPRDELRTPDRHVVRYHEQPSIYGDRMPRLVTQLSVDWFEALTGEVAWTTPWGIEPLRVLYVLETGTHLHVLTVRDFAKLDSNAETVVANARRAIFYDSYKIKPTRVDDIGSGLIRIFHSVEGLGASRAVLFPDFDYEAAREDGGFAVPSRDTIVIGRPHDATRADEVIDAVATTANEVLSDTSFPLCDTIWRMDEHEIWPDRRFSSARVPPEEPPDAVAPPADGETELD